MKSTDGVRSIKGVGEKAEQALAKLGIVDVEGLIAHYPRNYETYEPISPIQDAREGRVVAVEGRLSMRPKLSRIRGLTIVTCAVKDGTGMICLKWFNMAFLVNKLRMGETYIFRGKAVFKFGMLLIEQPQILTRQEFQRKLNVMQPVYALTEGLTNNAVTKAVEQAVRDVEWEPDYLPVALRRKHQFMGYKNAVKSIHFPKSQEEMLEARKRLAFDEFFLFLLALDRLKQQRTARYPAFVFEEDKLCGALVGDLPYELTNAQKRTWEEVKGDLMSGKLTTRLIQGDVGSGKTVIAALALLMAVENGCQGAIMVPTEVLAQQHKETLDGMLSPYGACVELLTGSMTSVKKRNVHERIASGEVQVIVGTHALIQEKCEYHKLGLVITDEQHRFGVKQREALHQKGEDCHTLVMSATPIPRSLALILYGDMDVSLIDELPSNRLPIKSCHIPTTMRKSAYNFIRKEVEAGRQAYVICPMVEEGENLELENVVEYAEQLKEELPSGFRIDYLHGQMRPKEKSERMEKFANGEIQVLVSTTVIEVGINVPNATVMVVENAERFGLAGLHQLRGRVGRGEWQSYAVFITGTESQEVKDRLEVLVRSNDGFFIASEDLRLRGPGDLFGIRQSGGMEFKVADPYHDADLLKMASDEVANMADKDLATIFEKKAATLQNFQLNM